MPNQITRIISLGELFTCIKCQCNWRKKTRIMSLFQKNAQIEDFENVTYFLIMFIHGILLKIYYQITLFQVYSFSQSL